MAVAPAESEYANMNASHPEVDAAAAERTVGGAWEAGIAVNVAVVVSPAVPETVWDVAPLSDQLTS